MSKIVDRTLDVFEMFATEKRPLSLTDMTHLLDIPISSCHDVIHALVARGYVYETAPRAGYYPTRRLQEIGQTIADNDSLVQRASPLLERLRDNLQETVNLSKATAFRVVYLLVLEPEHPIRYSVTVGSEIRSMYATSAGKAYLSTLSQSAFDEFLQSTQLVRLTNQTIVAKAKLAADIKQSKIRGWYLNRGESLTGVVTISSLFFWNKAVHIITVAGPADRMEAKLERAAKMIMDACDELGDGTSA